MQGNERSASATLVAFACWRPAGPPARCCSVVFDVRFRTTGRRVEEGGGLRDDTQICPPRRVQQLLKVQQHPHRRSTCERLRASWNAGAPERRSAGAWADPVTDAAVLSGQPLPAKQLFEAFFFRRGGVLQGGMMITPLNCSPYAAISSFYVRAPGRTAAFLRGDRRQTPGVEPFFFNGSACFAGRNPLIILGLRCGNSYFYRAAL